MSDEDYKYFVKGFLSFLKKQIHERNFGSDVIESLEVATQCLEAAYNITPSNNEGADDGVQQQRDNQTSNSEEDKTNTNQRHPIEDIDLFQLFQSACLDITPERKQQAEDVKNDGNRLMKEAKYNEALICYNKAISLDATNPVFYCNRAAAYIRLNEIEKAIADCKMSLIYNPNYSRAYGRMGIAYSNLQRYDQACDAYKRALELEPDNQDYQNNLRIAEQRIEAVATASNTSAGPVNLAAPRTQDLGQHILQTLPIDSPDLRNLISDMLADPMISIALGQMSRNRDGLLNMSRQLASQMINDYPDVISGVRHQLMNMAAQVAGSDAGPGDGGGVGAVTGTGTAPGTGTGGTDPNNFQIPPQFFNFGVGSQQPPQQGQQPNSQDLNTDNNDSGGGNSTKQPNENDDSTKN